MKIMMKKIGLLIALVFACFALPSCDDDGDNNNYPFSGDDISSQIVATWEKVNQYNVTVDAAGNINKSEGPKMQSSIWEFRKDGYQYLVQDGFPAEERYAFSIKGNEITLTQDVKDNPEIIKGVVKIANGTMTLDLYVYGEDNKNEYIEYIFHRTN